MTKESKVYFYPPRYLNGDTGHYTYCPPSLRANGGFFRRILRDVLIGAGPGMDTFLAQKMYWYAAECLERSWKEKELKRHLARRTEIRKIFSHTALPDALLSVVFSYAV